MSDFDMVMRQFTGPGLLEQLELLARIFIASMLGALIGIERKNQNKSAGVRTHAIVALGAALMMVVSKYGFADSAKVDASRIASQVVSGVSFLGAGVIFVRNNLINGLTTSAGIWATAGVGLALGCGQYVVGICSALMIIIVQMIMHKVAFFSNVASGGYLWMTMVKKAGVVEQMEEYLRKERVKVAAVKINKTKKDEVKLEFDVIYPPGYDKSRLLSRLVEMDDVLVVSE